MMDADTRNSLAIAFGQLTCDAGAIIMAHRRAGTPPTFKPDGSPVSLADTEAEDAIRKGLSSILPNVPMVAEESADVSIAGQIGKRFLLVDPLDGTREYIAGRDQFTVNIALIENGAPIVGAVYAPALQQLYVAASKAWRDHCTPGAGIPALTDMQPISVRPRPGKKLRALVSQSHLDAESEAMLDCLNITERQPLGSSLKFCLLAQGDADVYPRFGETMEWDTAAGHAVLVAAGGQVVDRNDKPLRYGKPGFRNDGFVAWGAHR
jgi:3'(2'), 5'-bisphosphate nucleotidase